MIAASLPAQEDARLLCFKGSAAKDPRYILDGMFSPERFVCAYCQSCELEFDPVCIC